LLGRIVGLTTGQLQKKCKREKKNWDLKREAILILGCREWIKMAGEQEMAYGKKGFTHSKMEVLEAEGEAKGGILGVAEGGKEDRKR